MALVTRIEEKIRRHKNNAMKNRICYECNVYGHEAAMCPNKKKIKSVIHKIPLWKEPEIKISCSALCENEEEMYLMSPCINSTSLQNWIVDSGASKHMCCDKKIFNSLQSCKNVNVVIASGAKIPAVGIGNVSLCVSDSGRRLNVDLHDVLFVPDIKTNLISVKKITERGYSVTFSGDKCFLSGNFGTYAIANHANGIYHVSLLHDSLIANHVNTECVHVWYRRLAHRNLNDVRKMRRIGIEFKPCDCNDVCEDCLTGKMSRSSFPHAADKKQERLECIVSDICEMPVESVGRSRYFITFTDLFSGYIEIDFLRKKSEAIEKSIHFIEKMKTQFNAKPKNFRSDRGGEYLSNKFQDYLSDNGIKFECTVGYAPEQNGVAERKNRTLVEAVRALLSSSSLPKRF